MVERKIRAEADDITRVGVDEDSGRETWTYDFIYDGNYIKEVVVTVGPHFNTSEEVHSKISESLKINVKRYEVEVRKNISIRLR